MLNSVHILLHEQISLCKKTVSIVIIGPERSHAFLAHKKAFF
jgi:hypothetical protein